MDALERIAPELVICRGRWQPVMQTIAHPPGTHADSPIRNELTAVELRTPVGSRWYGFERAWIGSDLRMHVSPINPRDEVVYKWETPA